MSLAEWLLSLAGPLIVRALIALGVGVLTVSGIDLALNQAMSWVSTSVGNVPSDLLNVLALGGVFNALSYVGGAMSARVAMAGASSVKRWFIK